MAHPPVLNLYLGERRCCSILLDYIDSRHEGGVAYGILFIQNLRNWIDLVVMPHQTVSLVKTYNNKLSPIMSAYKKKKVNQNHQFKESQQISTGDKKKQKSPKKNPKSDHLVGRWVEPLFFSQFVHVGLGLGHFPLHLLQAFAAQGLGICSKNDPRNGEKWSQKWSQLGKNG